MRIRFFLLTIIVIVVSTFLALGGLSVYKKYTKPKKVHFHAGFQVYVDGKLQDFSNAKYMNERPCTTDDKVEIEEDEQLEKAHLHDHVGNVVHVENVPSKWTDLFTNIRYQLPKTKPVKGFVNGNEINDILNYPIKEYDSVVIFIGENKEIKEKIRKAVTKEKIKEEEKKSESCAS